MNHDQTVTCCLSWASAHQAIVVATGELPADKKDLLSDNSYL